MIGKRLYHLEGIRGLAAVSVLFAHFLQIFLPHVFYADPTEGHGVWERELATSPLNILVNGNFAVCLFFVLSGYVLSRNFLSNGSLGGLRRLALKRYPRLMLPVLGAVMLAWGIPSLAFAQSAVFDQVPPTFSSTTNSELLMQSYAFGGLRRS